MIIIYIYNNNVYIYIHININDVGDIAVAATHSIWSMKVHGNWAQTRVVAELHRFIGDLPRKSCRNPSRKMWVADTEMASFSAELSAVIRQKWIHILPIFFFYVHVCNQNRLKDDTHRSQWNAMASISDLWTRQVSPTLSGMLHAFRYFEIKWFQFVHVWPRPRTSQSCIWQNPAVSELRPQ